MWNSGRVVQFLVQPAAQSDFHELVSTLTVVFQQRSLGLVKVWSLRKLCG